MGTLLGRPNEHGDVQVEGGEFPSILNWEERLRLAAEARRDVEMNGTGTGSRDGDGEDSRPPSSGLSSIGDEVVDEMELDLKT